MMHAVILILIDIFFTLSCDKNEFLFSKLLCLFKNDSASNTIHCKTETLVFFQRTRTRYKIDIIIIPSDGIHIKQGVFHQLTRLYPIDLDYLIEIRKAFLFSIREIPMNEFKNSKLNAIFQKALEGRLQCSFFFLGKNFKVPLEFSQYNPSIEQKMKSLNTLFTTEHTLFDLSFYKHDCKKSVPSTGDQELGTSYTSSTKNVEKIAELETRTDSIRETTFNFDANIHFVFKLFPAILLSKLNPILNKDPLKRIDRISSFRQASLLPKETFTWELFKTHLGNSEYPNFTYKFELNYDKYYNFLNDPKKVFKGSKKSLWRAAIRNPQDGPLDSPALKLIWNELQRGYIKMKETYKGLHNNPSLSKEDLETKLKEWLLIPGKQLHLYFPLFGEDNRVSDERQGDFSQVVRAVAGIEESENLRVRQNRKRKASQQTESTPTKVRIMSRRSGNSRKRARGNAKPKENGNFLDILNKTESMLYKLVLSAFFKSRQPTDSLDPYKETYFFIDFEKSLYENFITDQDFQDLRFLDYDFSNHGENLSPMNWLLLRERLKAWDEEKIKKAREEFEEKRAEARAHGEKFKIQVIYGSDSVHLNRIRDLFID